MLPSIRVVLAGHTDSSWSYSENRQQKFQNLLHTRIRCQLFCLTDHLRFSILDVLFRLIFVLRGVNQVLQSMSRRDLEMYAIQKHLLAKISMSSWLTAISCKNLPLLFRSDRNGTDLWCMIVLRKFLYSQISPTRVGKS